MGVGVGIGVSVAVGKGVAPAVAVGMDDAVGVTVEAGASDVQEEENVRRKMERTMRNEAVLFRMGCILPRLPSSFEARESFMEQKPSCRVSRREGSI